jgi:hypothetical protein
MKTIDDIAQEHFGQEISIVGNGPSLVNMPGHSQFFGRWAQYIRDNEKGLNKDINEYPPPLTHVKRLTGHPRRHWTVNGGWSYHPESNLGFVLDDMKFHRAETHPTHEWYSRLMEDTKIPVFTSRAYPDIFPSFIEYPLKEVVKKFKTKRFDETIHFMLALAGYFEVKKVVLLGCDYQPHDRFASERSGSEYWLGRLEQLGIEIDTSQSQYLMKPSVREPMYSSLFYGFALDNPLVHDKETLDIVNKVNY